MQLFPSTARQLVIERPAFLPPAPTGWPSLTSAGIRLLGSQLPAQGGPDNREQIAPAKNQAQSGLESRGRFSQLQKRIRPTRFEKD